MKKILLVFCCFYTFMISSVLAEDNMIFINPDNAVVVIKAFFGTMASDGWVEFKENEDFNATFYDEVVYEMVLKKYYEILSRSIQVERNAYLLSVDDIWNVCDVAFIRAKPFYKQKQVEYCDGFATAIVKWKSEPKKYDECFYKISKYNGSQKQIRYISTNGKNNFIRKDGTISWRFFNPGNLRRSSLACTRIKTDPNGYFAVFQDYETGRYALISLLKNDMYKNLTIDKAINIYAPPKENNTLEYIRKIKEALINAGVEDVNNKKFGDMTDKELSIIADTIEEIEGWNSTGTVINLE